MDSTGGFYFDDLTGLKNNEYYERVYNHLKCSLMADESSEVPSDAVIYEAMPWILKEHHSDDSKPKKIIEDLTQGDTSDKLIMMVSEVQLLKVKVAEFTEALYRRRLCIV